jgi:hypothetical protein
MLRCSSRFYVLSNATHAPLDKRRTEFTWGFEQLSRRRAVHDRLHVLIELVQAISQAAARTCCTCRVE